MDIWMWLGALLVGVTMGLFGSGGSILSVPILVYLVGESDKVAIAESLAIVGIIAVFALLPYARVGRIAWPTVVVFGIPGMAGAYVGASLAAFMPGVVQLGLFAIVMLAAAFAMLRPSSPETTGRRALGTIALDGLLIGVLTGLVGVGGGFLIVPALVVLGGLPLREAIGTSLAIIALKSAAGYVRYLDVLSDLNLAVSWELILIFAVVGVLGSIAGGRLAKRLPRAALQRAFAILLLVMSFGVLALNAPELLALKGPVEASASRP